MDKPIDKPEVKEPSSESRPTKVIENSTVTTRPGAKLTELSLSKEGQKALNIGKAQL